MDRYKRSILKKSKIYRPYTLDGIGNFYFSPWTITGIDFSACQVDPSGYVYGGSSYVYYHSYGSKHRRARTTTTSAVRGVWGRMAISAAAMSSSIPTGEIY